MSTSFFLSRRALKPAAHSGMPRWQDQLFIVLARSANDATDYLPDPDRPGGRGRHAGDDLSADAGVHESAACLLIPARRRATCWRARG